MKTITQEQLNQLADYLARMPYGQVYQLITMLATLPEAPKKDA